MYRQNGLQHTFIKLKEAGAPGDFPQVMANVAHKSLLKGFTAAETPWKTYAKVGSISDFKINTRTFIGEFSAWLKKEPGDGYKAGKISDYKYTISLGTYGRSFSLLRETVINDDLGAFTDVPTRIGRSGGLTLGEQVANVLESNPNAYDGSPLFGTRKSIANFSHTAPLTADTAGIAALMTGITAIKNAKDPQTGRKLGLKATYLIVPQELELTAVWLLTGGNLTGSTSSVAVVPDSIRRLKLVVDHNLTFTSRWYLCADPADMPFMEVGFLNGVMDPQVFVKSSNSIRVGGGGTDDFGYEYDDIEMKGRLDWGIAAAFAEGLFGGNQ